MSVTKKNLTPQSLHSKPSAAPFVQADPMPARGPAAPSDTSDKVEQLGAFRADPTAAFLTSDQGIPIGHTDDSLRAGQRGPTLLEDFHLREKIMRFDHERIPERAVHARGAGAHGVFKVYKPLDALTRAGFLNDPALETPVFVRFSTVAGSRGSADTARDVRGFAVKFYTQEGNFDLVGNNMPVFFIQDGIKFPDLIHAVKPEPANEIPQAASAHDTFWDFVSLVPETAHMIMWAMSDRALPRSYRMMEGFGVHTFRLVNASGKSSFVKFHWKPVLGAHSLVWDECLQLNGKDPDFHRRDLWNAIESGEFPEWELGLQVIPEEDEQKFGFDLIDSTKLIPEELVPVQRVGKLTLNRNPSNYFAETEQVAFCVGNVVPGIDFTNDPLLQARLFSYVDTQLTRLGGPNFAEIPINRPVAKVNNHQQDGFHRDTIATGAANYHPNSIGGGCPFLAGDNAFKHFSQPVEGHKTRTRSETFLDHFSQATLFLNSQSPVEREHITAALRFELGKVNRKEVRQRVLGILREIDPKLAQDVSAAIGVPVPDAGIQVPKGTSAPTHRGDNGGLTKAPSLSLENQPKDSIRTRKVALLVADGFSDADVQAVSAALSAEGAQLEVVSPFLGELKGSGGLALDPTKTFTTGASVLFDALYVPGGAASVTALAADPNTSEWIREAYKHCKAIAASGEGSQLLQAAGVEAGTSRVQGVVVASDGAALPEFAKSFVAAIKAHRHWGRQPLPRA